MASSTAWHQSFGALLHGETSAAVREEATRLLSDELFRPHTGLTEDEQTRLTIRRLRHICEALPRGSNLARDPERLFALVAATAVVDPSLSVAMIIHHGLCLSFLEDFTDPADRLRPFKEALVSGQAVGSFLITEIGRGNSQLEVRTEAVYDSETDGFILHTPDPGAQKFMGNVGLGGVPRIAVVTARLIVAGKDRGAFPFVIRLADGQGPTPGVHTTITRSGVVPMDYSLTRFDRVWLPRANWLSDDASIDDAGNFSDPVENRDKRLLRSVSTVQNVWAGMSGALAAVSTVAAASALHFSTRRRTTARIGTALPVLEYTTQHRPLFGCLADAMAISCLASAARSARIELIAAWRRGERASAPRIGTMTWAPWAPVNSELAMAKVMAAWTTERVTAECRLRCGVLGALASSRYLDYQGLGHMLNAGGGDNLLIVLDTARDLVTRAVELPGPDPSLHTREMALTDKALWRELNRRRVCFLARRTAEAVAQAPAAEDSFDAWNPHLMKARELGEAYGHGLVLDRTLTAVDGLPEGEAAQVADRLCAIHALQQLAKDAAWYLCEGLLSAEQVQRIDPALDELTRSLIPYTADLVEAFAADGFLAHSPLLADDYVQAVGATGIG
ncbi:acyl-CoA dehydrogenase [Streptomyces sp. NPDC102462]|uniref:acyl-CoA dehydrogenase n=1 Tax=Streptomyces sp. NPDC102462 TaxID=3366178 RepID=UPI0037F251D8